MITRPLFFSEGFSLNPLDFLFAGFQKYYPVGIFTEYLGQNTLLRKQLLRQHFQEEAQRRLLSELWEISRGAKSLDEADQNRLFCLLAAGYSLAEKTPKECPISSKDAENGFLNRVEVPRAESWVVIPDDGDICLEARREPYRILSAAKTMRFLPLGTCISQRKFVATPHAQQAAGIPVTLQVYAGEQDQNPTMLRIAVGDYLYTNFAGNTPIWFHPAVQESGACKIERKKRRSLIQTSVTNTSSFCKVPMWSQ